MKASNYGNSLPYAEDEEMKICPRCRGTGWENEWEELECTLCWGDGEVPA